MKQELMKYEDDEGNVMYRSKAGFNFKKHKFVGFIQVNDIFNSAVINAKDGMEGKE